MTSILYGLLSAIGWGAADFTGGLASRKTGAMRAVFFGELIGIFLVVGLAVFTRQAFLAPLSWALAMTAGMLGTLGLLMLYHSMTLGLMSIATPVSALLAAVIPVVVGAFTEGFPSPWTVLGFTLALAAVWMISQGTEGVPDILTHISDLKLPLLAGLGFGMYFILMSGAARDVSPFWPMVASRTGGLLIILIFMLARRESFSVTGSAWPMVLLNGSLDIAGNGFYILSLQAGRLDVSAVVSSLYPGATVVLAWVFLRERLSRNQWIGIALALAAIILLTL